VDEAAAGSIKWSYTTGGVLNSHSIGADGTLYIGCGDKQGVRVRVVGGLRFSATCGHGPAPREAARCPTEGRNCGPLATT
jgi:outer membrane protein assembly factor BamB